MSSTVSACMSLLSAVAYIAPFALFVSLVTLLHECGHLLVGRWLGVKAEVFSIGFGPELFGFVDRFGTRWRLSAAPVGGYVRFAGDRKAGEPQCGESPHGGAAGLAAQPLMARAAIVAAGPAANIVAAVLLFAAVAYMVGETIVPPRVGEVVAGGPAEAAGLRPGDLIRSLDGRPVAAFEDIINFVSLRPNEPVAIAIDRGGREMKIVATPTLTTVDTPAGRERVGRLGITISRNDAGVAIVRPGLLGALGSGLARSWSIVAVTGDYVGRIATGRLAPDQLSGPVGIARMSHTAASVGFVAFVQFAAVVSLSLGLTNLLPVPLLDGGHLLFYVLEAARGRPLGRRSQEFGLRAGLALVLMLMVFVTANDLRRLFES